MFSAAARLTTRRLTSGRVSLLYNRAGLHTTSAVFEPHGLTDEEIANANIPHMRPIADVANDFFGIDANNNELEAYGRYKAKLPFSYIKTLNDKPDGKLIICTALSPTRFGEGKTCTSVGLGDGLCKIGKNAMVSLREPSLGPVFGVKGGAAGGGYAQVVPMADINLHFTGDLHAIGAANNLLAAMLDNHIYWAKEPLVDVRRVTWRRVVDMNDRALRNITVGLGKATDGIPRSDGFDITVASEIMAIFCLATDMDDLQRRLGQIVVGYTRKNTPVTCKDLNADGALAALLRDALQPNLVQTLENNPAIIHGGPFANIAHGCSSVVSTKTSLKLCDYVVTEGGFGADLGAEKFFNIKCRKSGLKPDCAVIVATCRALKLHGGADEKTLTKIEDVDAVRKGMVNLERHVENVRKFGVPVVVAINQFPFDTDAEMDAVAARCSELGVTAVRSNHHGHGGAGAEALAEAVVKVCDEEESNFKFLYPDEMSLVDKITTVAKEMYHAEDIAIDPAAMKKLNKYTKEGYGHFPICMAKTQYSFSADPKALGAPTGHTVPVRDVRLSAGAEFIVVLTGDIMQMPGLPKVPAAENVGVHDDGSIYGMF